MRGQFGYLDTPEGEFGHIKTKRKGCVISKSYLPAYCKCNLSSMRCDSGHVNSFCLQVATNQDAYKYFLFSSFWAIKQLTGHAKVGV